MKRSILGLLVALIILGCATPQTVDLTDITLTVWNESYSEKTNHQLTKEAKELLESVLDRKPDHNINTAVEIDLSGVLVLDGRKYVIEPNRVLFLGVNFTKIWDQKGVRKELIRQGRILRK